MPAAAPPHAPEQCPLLHQWLAQATRGLCPDAVERVTREITEHYTAALEAHRAEGSPPEVAATLALKGLGSARHARRELKRNHFTLQEATLLAQLANTKVLGVKPMLPREMEWGSAPLWFLLLSLLLGRHIFDGGDQVQLSFDESYGAPHLWLGLSGLWAPTALAMLRDSKATTRTWRHLLRRLCGLQILIFAINGVLLAPILVHAWRLYPAVLPNDSMQCLISFLLIVMCFVLMPVLIIRTLKTLEKLPADDVPLTG